ncbi:MAG: 1-acyl-sn-glycerol-3-phosphate acyltransferase [Spirochaetes bacterium]|nr:1-acyl-sn-glycerol-3-phosphate acyltransferase [Spirochaetota bacterium]
MRGLCRFFITVKIKIGKILFYLILRLLRWNIDRAPIDKDRGAVLAFFPHESNFDAILGFLTFKINGLHPKTLAKSELFWFPFGIIMRFLGGIPVYRSSSSDMVSQMVKRFNEDPRFFLAIAPEGTRKRAETVKSGFWYIAKGANVPIHLFLIDKKSRRIRRLETLDPQGTYEEDIKKIANIYSKSGYKLPGF